MKKLLASSILFMLLPLVTSAATVQELQAQVQTLLQQINALQQTLGQPTTTAGAAAGGQCPLISRTLKQGASGDDVTRLQQFLARDPSVYPEAQVTGYYGALTEAAVKKFQCKNNVVCDGTPESTGYGVVGPRTAALLALQCPGGTAGGGGGTGGGTVGGYMRVTPVSGNTPLNVSFEVHTNTARACTGGSYELLYGDNSAPVVINVPAGACNEMVQTYTYTYRNPGQYTAMLRSGIHQSVVTIAVGGVSAAQSNDTIEASPTSGNAPLNVSFTGRANANASCSPSTYSIQFGDNSSVNIPVSQCSISNYAVTHGYSSGGNFTARLMRGSSEEDSVTINVGGNPSGSTQGGGSFSVSPGYGGDAFAVLATFAIASSCTAYDIDWGDGTAHSTQGTGTCATGEATKEVSHTYTGNGTYTITLKRGAGSSQTTDTVGVTVAY